MLHAESRRCEYVLLLPSIQQKIAVAPHQDHPGPIHAVRRAAGGRPGILRRLHGHQRHFALQDVPLRVGRRSRWVGGLRGAICRRRCHGLIIDQPSNQLEINSIFSIGPVVYKAIVAVLEQSYGIGTHPPTMEMRAVDCVFSSLLLNVIIEVRSWIHGW